MSERPELIIELEYRDTANDAPLSIAASRDPFIRLQTYLSENRQGLIITCGNQEIDLANLGLREVLLKSLNEKEKPNT